MADEPIPQPDPTPAFVPISEQFIEGDHPTANPDGVTNSNVDYSPKTQEEKAALMHVEMVQPVEIKENEPYPEGSPDPALMPENLLPALHSPLELVSADEWDAHLEQSLAEGGAVPNP